MHLIVNMTAYKVFNVIYQCSPSQDFYFVGPPDREQAKSSLQIAKARNTFGGFRDWTPRIGRCSLEG